MQAELNTSTISFENTVTRAFFSLLIDKVYMLSSASQDLNPDSLHVSNLLTLLNRAASLIQSSNVTNMVEPILIERFNASKFIQPALLPGLWTIAIWTQNEVIYEEIVNLLTTLFRKQVSIILAYVFLLS